MSLQETNKRIETLFKEWREIQPLKPEDKERFDKKVRLEWNYNSNHIEGNTLTYGETVALILEGKEEGIHPERDYMEMKAHDVAIDKVREFAEDKQRNLTEADIRGLNKIILKESFWKEAETTDGQKTQKEIIPGQYKTQPNHVRTETGEIFKFAEPQEVSPKMNELMDWFNNEIEKPTLPIASFIAELHHRFIVIHPFDDGNGRVVRLWVNYVLLKLGYPPLVIKSEEKRNYFAALQKADDEDMDTLATYLGNILVYWLEIGVKAAKGEDISEIEDIDKETQQFIRQQKETGLKVPITPTNCTEIFDKCFAETSKMFIKEFSVYSDLFEQTSLEITRMDENYSENNSNKCLQTISQGAKLTDENLNNLINTIKENFTMNFEYISRHARNLFVIDYQYYGYMGQANRSFDCNCKLAFFLEELGYKTGLRIKKEGLNAKSVNGLKKDYSQPYSEEEVKKLFAEGKHLFLDILKECKGDT